MQSHKPKLAITQMQCTENYQDNIQVAEQLVRQCKQQGADIVLLQELFAHRYFGPEQNPQWFSEATDANNSPILKHFQSLARELKLILPVSFFERKNNAFYNSLAMIDESGNILGIYRKSHIPDGIGYQEKFYFSPGDSGFQVWETQVGKIGVAICWDQWFPEAARVMALKGAELILYPTAIGNEPQRPDINSGQHWQQVMRGHAAANICYVAASNRVGQEKWPSDITMQFYGKSFVSNYEGQLLVEMDATPGLQVIELDFYSAQQKRQEWGLFRDRRPELYKSLLTLDGNIH